MLPRFIRFRCHTPKRSSIRIGPLPTPIGTRSAFGKRRSTSVVELDATFEFESRDEFGFVVKSSFEASALVESDGFIGFLDASGFVGIFDVVMLDCEIFNAEIDGAERTVLG
jgi:hypothetical protein